MQLETDPSNISEHFCQALRALAPGPGSWATAADLTHLKAVFSFPAAFDDPKLLSMACKLRVIHTIAPVFKDRVKELRAVQAEAGRRPFGV